jgi:hypothetical protein
MPAGELLINTMLKAKLIKRGILELGHVVTTNGFQAVGMLIVQPQSQAPKVLKHFILAFQEENPRVTRVVINNDKDIPLASHGANPRGTDSVHMEQLSGLLSHHGVNRRMGSSDHLAMMTRSTNVIPHSEIAETKPPYVCPGCFIHTYSNNMITYAMFSNTKYLFLTE